MGWETDARYWVGDFETTTDPEDCRVWAWMVASVEDKDTLRRGLDIESFMEWVSTQNTVMYFHNLAFDGSFILDWIMKRGYVWAQENPKPGQITSLISNTGKFYSIMIHWRDGHRTDLRDSLKKLPMSVSNVAKAFKLAEGKGELDYTKPRAVGYKPTMEEWDYIRRDVQIVAEALNVQLKEGMTRLTVGADSLHEYKELVTQKMFKRLFPVLAPTMDSEIRKAYRGGFTYADERHKGKYVGAGKVYDVNSLYPSVMYDRLLPFGVPDFVEGKPEVTQLRPLYIMSVTFTARLKKDHIPCIQVKASRFFIQSEYQTRIDEPVTMYCTNIDWDLWNKHYDIDVSSYNGGWVFRAAAGFFRTYIDKWMEVKANSTGGRRQIAKLHLNSLYGKFATNPDVTGKYPVLEDDTIKLRKGIDETRDPVYTPMGVFITAYARQYTIETAQANYDTFAYADTDSLHLLTDSPNDPEGLHVHPTKLGAWKWEYDFTRALYIRAKAYCELKTDGQHETHIAGLPERVTETLTLDKLKDGTHFSGKLTPKRVPGGIVLDDVGFTLKF